MSTSEAHALTDETQIEPKKQTYQIPTYTPQHVLSPEFQGTSNYEVGLSDILKEKTLVLQRLQNNSKTNPNQIQQAQEELKELSRLYENYNIGMNVFRTAKGGRDKIRE
ncbi:MAG: hypothetical protein HZC29_08620 [Thaumarchaeota archaeon]|nr:hypothetical protein [Nitrososphaerota archaeon]